MTTLPDYVSSRGHGEISFEIPARMTGATAYQFVLAAARAPLQRFVDAQLNRVSNGAVHYTALPFLFHYYMDVERVTSIPEVIGYVPYREAGFMVPLLQKREGHLLPELKLWLPYILIDRDCGMVAGREVWGYPKAMGVMTMNPDPAQATHCAAETTIFRTLQPDTRGERATLFETNRVTGGTHGNEWGSFGAALGGLFGRALGDVEQALAGVAGAAIDALALHPQAPVINLKQFRDAADSRKACYQALVNGPVALDTWRGGGFLGGDYEVTITACESHAIVTDLGLGAPGADKTVIPAKFGGWMKMDFSALQGDIVWQTP